MLIKKLLWAHTVLSYIIWIDVIVVTSWWGRLLKFDTHTPGFQQDLHTPHNYAQARGASRCCISFCLFLRVCLQIEPRPVIHLRWTLTCEDYITVRLETHWHPAVETHVKNYTGFRKHLLPWSPTRKQRSFAPLTHFVVTVNKWHIKKRLRIIHLCIQSK